jgi:tRNA pseudouridine38-40 synthase
VNFEYSGNNVSGNLKSETVAPSARRNVRLTIAFDGTAYCGWQMQSASSSIQGAVSAALAEITGEPISLTGSGRTDAGTHARGLIANFFTGSKIPVGRLPFALNSMLPRDIRILAARDVPAGFHARKSAISKIYRYQIYTGTILPPNLMREHFHFPYPIDFDRMAEAAKLFLGEHDFASYAKTGSGVSNTVRHIYRCDLKRQGARVYLTVEGNGFLHHMVRNMAGTLLDVGRKRIGLSDFAALFEKRDRTQAGFTAPAHGLILVKVRY